MNKLKKYPSLILGGILPTTTTGLGQFSQQQQQA